MIEIVLSSFNQLFNEDVQKYLIDRVRIWNNLKESEGK